MASKYRERIMLGVDDEGKPIYQWVCGKTKEELHKAIGYAMMKCFNPLDVQREFLKPYGEKGFVICRESGNYIGEHYSEQTAKNAWNRITKTIDVHGITPYSGRHTYATQMSKIGIPMKTAISLMGHTDERMLARHYIHTDTADILAAGRKMEQSRSSACL